MVCATPGAFWTIFATASPLNATDSSEMEKSASRNYGISRVRYVRKLTPGTELVTSNSERLLVMSGFHVLRLIEYSMTYEARSVAVTRNLKPFPASI